MFQSFCQHFKLASARRCLLNALVMHSLLLPWRQATRSACRDTMPPSAKGVFIARSHHSAGILSLAERTCATCDIRLIAV